MAITVPPVRGAGDLGHVDDSNTVREALLDLDTAATSAQGAADAALSAVGDHTHPGELPPALPIAGGTMTGQLLLPNGEPAAPSLAHAGDTNAGLFFPAADTVAVATSGAERVRVDASGRLLLGHTSAVSTFAAHLLQQHGKGTTTSSAAVFDWADAATGAYLVLAKSRGGTIGTGALVSNDDVIGQLRFYAHDGGAWRQAAAITATVDGTAAASDMPARLGFWTTADGAASPTERMRINSAGLITGSGTSLGAWTAYTPTVTALSGTFTSVSGSGRYCRMGKTVFYTGRVTITTNGTAATAIVVTAPLAAASGNEQHGSGRETTTTGKQQAVRIVSGASELNITNYDNTYPGANGYVIDFSITYETSA